jgi:hypothetical protein
MNWQGIEQVEGSRICRINTVYPDSQYLGPRIVAVAHFQMLGRH